MTNSKAVQHRIMTTFSTMKKWKNYQLVLDTLINFFDGEKIRINAGWTQTRGHSSLLANSEGRHTLRILKAVNASVQFGNDAPRGGAIGNYFKCSRKNVAASAFFKSLLDEVKAK